MSKQKRKQKPDKKQGALENFSLNSLVPEKYLAYIIPGIILVLFLIFFYPLYFGGKTYQSGDIVTSKSLESFIDNEREDYTLWYPYIFCGMPAYGLSTDYKWFNFIWVGISSARSLYMTFFDVEYAKWTFYLLILAFNSFFLVYYLTKNRLISLFGAVSTSFSTGLILFLFIGHVTKLTALAFYPLIFLMLLRFREEIRLRDIAILIIAVQLSFQGWHVQIIYYTGMAVGIYFLYSIIRSYAIKDKRSANQFMKAFGIYAGAFIIAVLIQSDNLTQIYEYNEYSTRGSESILDINSGKAEDKKADSDFYQYATNWSFSPGEVMTFIIPSYYGFGNSTYKGPLSNNREAEVNTYFGQMPFVDVAMYMGVIIFFLALFSVYVNRKDPFVQFLAILSLFSILVSFGRTFPIFYDLLFYYLPFFNKFRVPSMILILAQLSFPVLAAMGLKKIIDLRNEMDERALSILKYASFIFTGVFIISILAKGAVAGWFEGRVADYASGLQNYRPQMAGQYNALKGYMAEMFTGDMLFAFGASALVFWICYFYVVRKVSADIAIIAIIIISTTDLLRIDVRPVKMQDAKNVDQFFTEPEYVKVIKSRDDNQPYRILNLKQDGTPGSFRQNQNFNAYFLLQDFYGYSSIKPRAYQDYIDVVGIVNPIMWNMLNVKYIVTDKPMTQPNLRVIHNGKDGIIYQNMTALPRAYFVDSVEKADPYLFLNDVKNQLFNPVEKAFVTDTDIPEIETPDSTANVKIVDYLDEKIEMDVKASGNNLMFLGDTFFPKGWDVTIDGEEGEIIRLNHGFRGVIIPEGEHKVVMKYLPASFVVSKYLALILSALTIIGLIIGILIERRKRKI